MEMVEHPDISAMRRYGTLENTYHRKSVGFLYGYVFERGCEENEEDEYDGEYEK